MAFTVRSFDTIVQTLVAWIVTHSTKITDLSPGSVIRSFCEATAFSIEELYTAIYLGFRRELEFMKESIFDFARKDGTKATTTLQFGRPGTSGTITIPIGFRVQTASGLVFVTTTEGTISAGNTTSNAVSAQSEENGADYNVASSTITTLVDDADGVETVTNTSAAVGGLDSESDASYHKRFQTYVEGLAKANKAGLLTAALETDGVTSASLVEYFPPVSNVNGRLYIDDGSAVGVSTALVNEVQAKVDGDGTQASPGYRAVGVNIVVDKPTIVTQNIAVDITILDDGSVDNATLTSDIETALTDYVNNLGIGDDIIHAKLVAAVMGVYGVVDCDVTTPSGTVAISAVQVGRVGTITVNIA